MQLASSINQILPRTRRQPQLRRPPRSRRRLLLHLHFPLLALDRFYDLLVLEGVVPSFLAEVGVLAVLLMGIGID